MGVSTPINFGNGITADFEGVPGVTLDTGGRIEKGHYGFLAPTVEIDITEHGIGDGGTVGTIRATSRKMRCTITHRALWMRKEIQQAFTPGVLRTLTTDLGTMPYYVQDLEFPESLAEARYKFTVAIVSPLAYPIGALAEIADDGSQWDVETAAIEQTTDSGTYTASGPFGVHVGQSFDPVFAERVTAFEYTVDDPPAWMSGWYLTVVDGELSTDPVVSTQYVYAASVAAGTHKLNLATPFVADGGVYTAFLHNDLAISIGLAHNAAGGYADGSLIEDDAEVAGKDLAFKVYTQAKIGVATLVLDEFNTDVPVPAIVTCYILGSAASLKVSDGTNVTTITHAFLAGDVVVIDSKEHAVTINGVDALADFDRLGNWPMLGPGVNTLEFDPNVTVVITAYPAFMGLI